MFCTDSYFILHVRTFQGRDVLVDVVVINERDPLPAGFTCVDFTVDSSKSLTPCN